MAELCPKSAFSASDRPAKVGLPRKPCKIESCEACVCNARCYMCPSGVAIVLLTFQFAKNRRALHGGLYVLGECGRIPLSSVERQIIDLASPFRFRGGRGRRTKDNERNGRHEQDCANGGHGGAVLRRFRTARRAGGAALLLQVLRAQDDVCKQPDGVALPAASGWPGEGSPRALRRR